MSGVAGERLTRERRLTAARAHVQSALRELQLAEAQIVAVGSRHWRVTMDAEEMLKRLLELLQ